MDECKSIRKLRGTNGTRFASNLKFDAKVIKFFEDMDGEDEDAEIEILEVTPSNGIYCMKVDGSLFQSGGLETSHDSGISVEARPVFVTSGSFQEWAVKYEDGSWSHALDYFRSS